MFVSRAGIKPFQNVLSKKHYCRFDLRLNQAAAPARNNNINPKAVAPDISRKTAPAKNATARMAKRMRLFILSPFSLGLIKISRDLTGVSR